MRYLDLVTQSHQPPTLIASSLLAHCYKYLSADLAIPTSVNALSSSSDKSRLISKEEDNERSRLLSLGRSAQSNHSLALLALLANSS
jgi:hypothetical protein